jgi:hypothetical protein
MSLSHNYLLLLLLLLFSLFAMVYCAVLEWVTVSEEHYIYIADVGLTPSQCDELVGTTEQVCKGQYAAYTYAKQTLGCREFPILAQAASGPVHTVVHAITSKFQQQQPQPQPVTKQSSSTTKPMSTKEIDDADDKCSATDPSDTGKVCGNEKRQENKDPAKEQQRQQELQLDDREPHIVKYDVTRKERQKLDMHTDKSEWTFLIALSNGCGVDYEGGGTYFECLDATVHIQRGHALIFPGKLRHCGQKITSGLRFLLVGFLVDKQDAASTKKISNKNAKKDNTSTSSTTNSTAMANKTCDKPATNSVAATT